MPERRPLLDIPREAPARCTALKVSLALFGALLLARLALPLVAGPEAGKAVTPWLFLSTVPVVAILLRALWRRLTYRVGTRLFLSYLLGGTMKWVRTKHGERMPPLRALEDFEITRSENPQKVAGQLYRDFPLAHDITFSCFTLDRGQGRKPAMDNSFDIFKRNVDRARRVVRDL